MLGRLKLLKERFNFDPKIIYDIGAYEGTWTKDIKTVFNNAKYYQFEANTDKKIYIPNAYFEVLSDQDNRQIIYNKTKSNCQTGNSILIENTKYFAKENLIEEKRTTITLASLIEREKLPIPQFLKIDTQGSELAILKGLGNYLDKIEIIQLELSLHQYNKGAPLISDITVWLSNQSWVMFDIVELHYIEGILAQIDGLFCKKESKYIIAKF